MRKIKIKKESCCNIVYLRRILLCLMFLTATIMCNTISAKAAEKISITVDFDSYITPTKAIQAALDMAQDNNFNGKLYYITIPEGKYDINSQLKIYSNTYLSMQNVTLVRKFTGTMMKFGREAEYVGYTGFSNITIDGGTWDGNGKNNPTYSSSLIRFAHANNITIKNAEFTNAVSSHHIECAAVDNLKVTDCIFSNYYGKSNTNNEALQFDIMNLSHFPKYGKYDETPCKNITVSGCTFKNLQRGLGSHSAIAGSYFTNMKFTKNTFKDIDGYAIIAVNYKNSEISDNIISDCGSGISFRYMVKSNKNFYAPSSKEFKIVKNSNSSITGNTITVEKKSFSATAYGISLYGKKLTKEYNGIPKGDYRLYKVTVLNNTVNMKNLGYGIWLEGASKIDVLSNKITCDIPSNAVKKGNGDGIRLVSSTNAAISKNTIVHKNINSKSKESCGIAVTESSSAGIDNNIIKGSGKVGIFVNDKCSVTAASNNIANTKKWGIAYYNGSKGTLKKNVIKGCKEGKIYIAAGCKVKK